MQRADLTVVGVDVGGTDVKLVVWSGVVHRSTVFPTRAAAGPDHMLDEIARAVRHIVPSGGHYSVGVALPGLVRAGHLIGGLNLPGWTDVPVEEGLASRLGTHVVVRMDSEAAGEAERLLGGHGDQDMVVLTLGTGVGMATVLNGESRAGAGGVLLMPELDDTGADNGTPGRLDRLLGSSALAELIPSSHPLRQQTPADVALAARGGDLIAIKAWTTFGARLGWAASHFAQLLLVERVVVSGGMAGGGDLLFLPAREHLDRWLPAQLRCELVPSRLGRLSGAIGAALLVRRSLI